MSGWVVEVYGSAVRVLVVDEGTERPGGEVKVLEDMEKCVGWIIVAGGSRYVSGGCVGGTGVVGGIWESCKSAGGGVGGGSGDLRGWQKGWRDAVINGNDKVKKVHQE